jgi:hypothetical protein
MDVVFDIDGQRATLTEPSASLIAEKLRCFAVGCYPKDVEYLTQCGYDPSWLQGAPALADFMEDVLVGRRTTALPLDPAGKATTALANVLRISAPVSFNATSDQARLFNALRVAQEDSN